jgi:RNA recognition motif-containing protein
MRTGQAPPNKQ